MTYWLKGIGVPAHVMHYERGTDALIIHESQRTTVKIPRVDSNYDPLREAHVLWTINTRDAQAPAPRLFSYSPFHVRIERINCPPIESILSHRPLPPDITCSMISAARKLDILGVDHGELARPYKHVRICPGNRIVFIDFGRASLRRRASNLTSVFSFILSNPSKLSGEQADAVRKQKSLLVELLGKYKRNPQEAFERLLEAMGCGGH